MSLKASAASIIKIKDEKYLQELLNKLQSETQHVSDEKEHVFDIIKFINEKLENTELIFEIEELVKSFDSINDSNFVKQLINCIEDCKAEDRIILIDLLGEVENPLVINALIKYLKDDDTRIRWSAKESLGKLASTNLNEVIKLIDHEDSDVRYVIVYILTEMDDDRVIDPLLKSLYDPDPDIRFKTLEFLNTIDDERIISYVNGLVNDPNVGVRIFAIDITSKKGDENSLEYLYDALSDEDYKVRKEAKKAIRMIKSRFKGNLGPEIKKKKIKMDINVSKTEISVHENKNPMKLLSELRKN